jgi:hypothetical protein
MDLIRMILLGRLTIRARILQLITVGVIQQFVVFWQRSKEAVEAFE